VGTVFEENLRAAMEKREIRRFEIGGRYTDAWYSMTAFPSPEGITVLGTDISEKRLAEEALRASENRLRTVLDATQESIWMFGPDGTVLLANAIAIARMGKKPEDILGKGILEILPPHVGRPRLERLRQVIETARPVEFEDERAGMQFRHSFYPALDREGRVTFVVSFSRDITERKKMEAFRQALLEQDRLRLGAAVEQASDAVVMFDLDGTIRYVNAAFESINQLPREQAVGRSYFNLFAGDPAAPAFRQAVAAGQAWHGPVTRPIPDGRTIDLDVMYSPAKDPAGTVIGGLATETDVTQKNALQQQVRQAQKMEALGTLAGGITHDFNNILGTIIINTELALLDIAPNDPARRPLPIVLQAANRGKELVKQIITFSRQREWERKPLAIAPIIKEGMGLLRSTLPKDITVHEAIDDASGVALADPSHIHQILVNLCQNAALAMRDHGGDLEVTLKPVEVDEAMTVRHPDLEPGPYMLLTVADTGCGMTDEIVDRIFEPFFTTREQGQGSGLGLAVVLGIVKSYRGAILVRSKPGQGSVFDVYIPRLSAEALAAGNETPFTAARGRARILLVEDEEAQRASLARGLERLGYTVTAAADGRAALETFGNDPAAFDLVITDQTMPRMSGLELASELSTVRPDLPVILCTGFSEKVAGRTVGQNGIREMAMKPFTITEISQLIRKALGKESGGPPRPNIPGPAKKETAP
jgi:PAS domain S-box-containing protein